MYLSSLGNHLQSETPEYLPPTGTQELALQPSSLGISYLLNQNDSENDDNDDIKKIDHCDGAWYGLALFQTLSNP